MEVVLLKKAREDRDYWQQTGNVKIMKRISQLLKDIEKHPFTGMGKPEPLKGNLQGKWSRRITNEHRMVYSISSGRIYVYVFSMKGHYILFLLKRQQLFIWSIVVCFIDGFQRKTAEVKYAKIAAVKHVKHINQTCLIDMFGMD